MSFYEFLLGLSRRAKQAIVLTGDTLAAPLSLYAAFGLRYETIVPLVDLPNFPGLLLPITALIGLATSYFCGLHRIKLASLENRGIIQIAVCAAILTVVMISESYLFRFAIPDDFVVPRSVPPIFGTFFFLTALAMRLGALQIIGFIQRRNRVSAPVIIYGAGAAGIQLASALKQSNEARVVAFVDDRSILHNLRIAGLPVHSPKELEKLIARNDVQRILFALPSVSKERQAELLQSLAHIKIELQILPSFIEIMDGHQTEAEPRPVSVDTMLGRDKVSLDIPEIPAAYAGRTIMITGAGGSIGSELCRQLIECQPAEIVLFERSEIALYAVDSEIRLLTADTGIQVHSILGSVADPVRVEAVVRKYGVDTILHSAAYKHVPLVETNEIEGARNNVLGTLNLCRVAAITKVERFILISTDKAVRPTSIMGGTKRLAELVIQDIQTRHPKTKFSMVRFGNVLGSSGSVLPLFQKQIAEGGPVTVTHPDVTRYFMTTAEAARLVLLAGSFSLGGDIFVLDMGKPRKILDIARQMILLSGRRIKETGKSSGDIEIKIVGLRPGEKLYEELLIAGDSLVSTPNEKILRAKEASLSEFETSLMLRELTDAISTDDTIALRAVVAKWVHGLGGSEQIADIDTK